MSTRGCLLPCTASCCSGCQVGAGSTLAGGRGFPVHDVTSPCDFSHEWDIPQELLALPWPSAGGIVLLLVFSCRARPSLYIESYLLLWWNLTSHVIWIPFVACSCDGSPLFWYQSDHVAYRMSCYDLGIVICGICMQRHAVTASDSAMLFYVSGLSPTTLVVDASVAHHMASRSA